MINDLELLALALMSIPIVSMVVFIVYATYLHLDIFKSMFRDDNDKLL
jgi:hypothetical protein